MSPSLRRQSRQPLVSTPNILNNDHLKTVLIDIFDKSQFISTSELALTQLRKVYRNSNFNDFERAFKSIFKRFLHSKEQTNYFKTTCELVCKFLQPEQKQKSKSSSSSNNNSQTADQIASTTLTNLTLTNNNNNRRNNNNARKGGRKRKEISSDEEDEIVSFISTQDTINRTTRSSFANEDAPPITDHDRMISSCFEVIDLFMQAADDTCRMNAVYFVCKFLSYCRSIDEEIFKAIQMRLTERIRDKRPKIRAQAVLACHSLQENKTVQDAFNYHFYRDPEIVVRKALLQVMDPKIFKLDFLIDSTQDGHELLRTMAYQKIGKVAPQELSSKQLHTVIHNGLNERERRPNYAFKMSTLEPWLGKLYDKLDLIKFIQSFDCIEYYDDICKLLVLVFERDLDKIENNGVVTRLHHVVENFRKQNFNDQCIPQNMDQFDEKMITVWLSLIKYCKANQSLIKPVKVRTHMFDAEEPVDMNNSLEKILNSSQRQDDLVELYERLVPDLINLIEFLKNFTQHCHEKLEHNNNKERDAIKYEFIYQKLMEFILTYEVGDEVERKTVQEVLGHILKSNLLTGHFEEFISPLIKCLNQFIYSSNPSQMLNYISELINNVRSHLEDVYTTSKQTAANPLSRLSTIPAPSLKQPSCSQAPRSAKKVRITEPFNAEDLECKIAKIRVDLEELKDLMENCIKEKDFDGAKAINDKIEEQKSKLSDLNDRRYSAASDLTDMSMVIDTESGRPSQKLSSTVLADNSFNESNSMNQDDEEIKIFKNHTNELIKCLQMYFAVLENVKLREVPTTMLNHLNLLSYECLDEWFKDNTRVRSLMVVCNGITALIDEKFAKLPNTMTLLIAACFDPISIEVKTAGFVSLVDVICQYDDIEYPEDKIEKFLKLVLRDYGQYNKETSSKSQLEFANVIIEGTSKLFYYKKLSCPLIFSMFIIWWYHPKTESRLKQFIGVFLPMFVKDLSRRSTNPLLGNSETNTWLRDLLVETFITSIEYLHTYISGPGVNIMEASDMLSLINFLSSLVPIPFHRRIQVTLDFKLDELTGTKKTDLMKYFKIARNSLIVTTDDVTEVEETQVEEPVTAISIRQLPEETSPPAEPQQSVRGSIRKGETSRRAPRITKKKNLDESNDYANITFEGDEIVQMSANKKIKPGTRRRTINESITMSGKKKKLTNREEILTEVSPIAAKTKTPSTRGRRQTRRKLDFES